MWRSWIPLSFVIIIVLIALILGVSDDSILLTFRKHDSSVRHFIDLYPFLSPLIFICIYVICTACSLPIAGILSLMGGYLFGVPLGTIYIVIGATMGACGIYLIVDFALSKTLRNKHLTHVQKMQHHLKRKGWSYLLVLRFIPLFPFWLVNILPPLAKVPFRTFLWTTFLGIIPGSYAYSEAGLGLGKIIAYEEISIFNINLIIGLVILSVIALLPAVIKR